jgi:hypothetical protein
MLASGYIPDQTSTACGFRKHFPEPLTLPAVLRENITLDQIAGESGVTGSPSPVANTGLIPRAGRNSGSTPACAARLGLNRIPGRRCQEILSANNRTTVLGDSLSERHSPSPLSQNHPDSFEEKWDKSKDRFLTSGQVTRTS